MMKSEDERHVSKPTEKSIEDRVAELETRIGLIEAMLARNKPTKAMDATEDTVVENLEKVGTQDAVIICLQMKGPQTRDQIREVLEKWGQTYGSWFYGGNFNNRLVKRGIVKVEGKNDAGVPIYALTMKGERIADEKLKSIASGSK